MMEVAFTRDFNVKIYSRVAVKYQAVATVGKPVAVIPHLVAMVGKCVAFVRHPVALIGKLVAIIPHPVAVIEKQLHAIATAYFASATDF